MSAFLRRASIAAAFALTLGLAAGSAEAGVATPATGAAVPSDVGATPENVRWVCGPFHCWWRPNYPAFWVTPPYARAWAPPPGPRCYWRRGWGGQWVQVCP